MAPPNRGSSNSPHILGTHVPVDPQVRCNVNSLHRPATSALGQFLTFDCPQNSAGHALLNSRDDRGACALQIGPTRPRGAQKKLGPSPGIRGVRPALSKLKAVATKADTSYASRAPHHPCDCLGSDKDSTMIIERSLSVVGLTRNLLNQLAVRFKNLRVGAGQVQAVSMISQCFVAHLACYRCLLYTSPSPRDRS